MPSLAEADDRRHRSAQVGGEVARPLPAEIVNPEHIQDASVVAKAMHDVLSQERAVQVSHSTSDSGDRVQHATHMLFERCRIAQPRFAVNALRELCTSSSLPNRVRAPVPDAGQDARTVGAQRRTGLAWAADVKTVKEAPTMLIV